MNSIEPAGFVGCLLAAVSPVRSYSILFYEFMDWPGFV